MAPIETIRLIKAYAIAGCEFRMSRAAFGVVFLSSHRKSFFMLDKYTHFKLNKQFQELFCAPLISHCARRRGQ